MTGDTGFDRPRRSDRHVGQPRRAASRKAGRSDGRGTGRDANRSSARDVGRHAVTGRSRPDARAERQARQEREHNERKQRRKRIAIIVLSVIGVVLLSGAAYGYSLWHKIETAIQAPERTSTTTETAEAEVQPDDPFTILLLGDDSRPGETMARSDTMIVAKVDPQTGQVWMLSIPRDTRVEIPGYGVDKINAATAYGGVDLAIETVEDFLGVKIDYYMTVNFTGFVEVVDALGGVYVQVDEEINDSAAASHSAGAAAHIDAGYQLLDGEHALTFVRARHQYIDGDFSRMRNQQTFFKALAEQVKSSGNVLKIPSIVTALADHITTDMELSKIVKTALALKDVGSGNIYTATVTGTWETPYVWPDEDVMEDLVARMEAGVSFDDTATVAPIGPSDVSVTIRNGAGISGVARAAGDILSEAGFVVADVGNAQRSDYETTLMIYDETSPDGLAKAQAVLAAMPLGELAPSNGEYTLTADVLVVVGQDWESVSSTD